MRGALMSKSIDGVWSKITDATVVKSEGGAILVQVDEQVSIFSTDIPLWVFPSGSLRFEADR